MIRAIICGVNGKMGQVLAQCITGSERAVVIAGVDKYPGACQNPFPVYGNIFECEIDADVIIDFSRPEAVSGVLTYAQVKGMAVVIATTGFSADELASIKSYAQKVPVFMSANMSLGVNLQMELVKKAAEFLGRAFDIEIVEKHHNTKIDSPSGTALALAQAASSAFPKPMRFCFGRHSKTERRGADEVGIHAVRGGTLAGEHEVFFIGADEVLEVNHRAHSKHIFANGALRAALYIVGKPAGLYNMNDILAEQNAITNLYVDEGQAIITINRVPHAPRFIANLFNALAAQNINIDVISQTSPHKNTVNISFSLHEDNLKKAVDLIENFKNRENGLHADIITGVCKLTVEGTGMARQSGVAARVFDAFAACGIRIEAITTSETKLALCIGNEDRESAITAVSQVFGL